MPEEEKPKNPPETPKGEAKPETPPAKAAEPAAPAAGAAPAGVPAAPAAPAAAGAEAPPAAGTQAAPAAEATPPPPPPPPPPSGDLANVAKILIADDVALMRNLLARALTKAGYVVIEARHGQDALKLAVREKPDLIILDNMMPVMSGPECLKVLRATEGFKEVPVLMCTARSEKSHVVEAVQLGVNDYILKPFRIEAVLERVAKHLPPEKRAR